MALGKSSVASDWKAGPKPRYPCQVLPGAGARAGTLARAPLARALSSSSVSRGQHAAATITGRFETSEPEVMTPKSA